MIETITYKESTYPKFQSEGFAAKFAFPFAEQVCKGIGYDVGCNRYEWAFPGSILVDPLLTEGKYDAYELPALQVDYIFSSHCLEHLRNWVEALDYWKTKLKKGGVLFLYLPSPTQKYWKPWHNRKHIHSLYPDMIKEYLQDNGWIKIFVSGEDLNNSFYAIAERP